MTEAAVVERTQLMRAAGRSGGAVCDWTRAGAGRGADSSGCNQTLQEFPRPTPSECHYTNTQPRKLPGQNVTFPFITTILALGFSSWSTGRLHNKPPCLLIVKAAHSCREIWQNWPCFVQQEFVLMLCFVSMCRYHLWRHNKCPVIHYGQVHR